MEIVRHRKRAVVYVTIERDHIVASGCSRADVADGSDVDGVDQRQCPSADLDASECLLGQSAGTPGPLGRKQAVAEQQSNGEGDGQDASPRRLERRAERGGHSGPPFSPLPA